MSLSETSKPRYVLTAEDRIWRLRRWGYYLAHIFLFALLSKWIGPNLLLFHSIFSPSPDYYATLTSEYVPAITAIKMYQAAKGTLPDYTDGIPKTFQPTNYIEHNGTICGTTSVTFALKHEVLEYEFSTDQEGWTIYAPRYQGRLNAPVVPAPASATNNQMQQIPNDTQ
jgi:hypothetical protein